MQSSPTGLILCPPVMPGINKVATYSNTSRERGTRNNNRANLKREVSLTTRKGCALGGLPFRRGLLTCEAI